ncbi:MAG: cysteine peptidase family C39 domain-containing protein, partial [Candidatus Omnitrophota bacterium]
AVLQTTDPTQTPSILQSGDYAIKLTYNYNKTFDATAPPADVLYAEHFVVNPPISDIDSLNYSLSEISSEYNYIKEHILSDDTIINTKSFKASLLSQVTTSDGTIIEYFNDKPVSVSLSDGSLAEDIVLEKYNTAITDYKVESGLLVGYECSSVDKIVASFIATNAQKDSYTFKNNDLVSIDYADGTTITDPANDAFSTAILALVENAFSPDSLQGEKKYEESDVTVNLDNSSRVTYFINNKTAATYYRHDNGQLDLLVYYSYDADGNLAFVRMPYARDSIDGQIETAKQKIAAEKAEYLETLAKEKGLAYQQIQQNVESVRAQIESERDRLQPMLYQEVTRVSNGCWGPEYYTETIEVPEVRNALNQLDEQERILNEQAAAAYANLDAEIASARAKLETDKTEVLSEIAIQEEEMHSAIIEEEATPVILECYRTLLGRDPDANETSYWLSKVDYDSRIDADEIKAALLGSAERACEEIFVSEVKAVIMNKLAEYLAADPAARSSIIASLGLSENDVVALNQEEIDAIIAFLNKQNIHFGKSAFVSLEALLSANNVTYDGKDIAVKVILIDIFTGSISAVSEGELLELSMFAISKTAGLYGLVLYNTKLVSDDLADIFSSGGAFIAHLKNDHFVVVTNIDSDGNITYTEVNRGASGTSVTVSSEDFKEAWTGYAITKAKPADDNKIISVEKAQHIKGSCLPFLLGLVWSFVVGVVTIAAGVVSGIAAVVMAVSAVIAPIIEAIGAVITGITNLLAGIGAQIFTAIKFVGVSLLKGVGAFFGGTMFAGAVNSVVTTVTGFASTIMGTAIGKTVVLTALSFGISKGLEGLGVNPVVSSLISSFLTGGVSGLCSSFTAVSFITGGLQGLAVQGVSALGQQLGIDPTLSSIIGIAAGSIVSAAFNGVEVPMYDVETGNVVGKYLATGLDAVSYSLGATILPSAVSELAYYGVTQLGDLLGIDERISYLAGIGIRSSLNAGLNNDWKPEAIWNSVTTGLLQGVTSVAINYATEELDLDPLLANIGFSAISSVINAGIQAATGGNQNIFEAVFDTYIDNALTFLGYTEDGAPLSSWQQSAYLSQVMDFSEIVKERGLTEALNTYAAGFLNSIAINQIIKSGQTIGEYFTGKLNSGESESRTLKDGTVVRQVAVPDSDGNVLYYVFFEEAQDGTLLYWDIVGTEEKTGSGSTFSWGNYGIDEYGKLGYTDAELYSIFDSDIQYQKIVGGQQAYAEIKDSTGKTLLVIEPTESGGYNIYNSYGDYVDAKINAISLDYNISLAGGLVEKFSSTYAYWFTDEQRASLQLMGYSDNEIDMILSDVDLTVDKNGNPSLNYNLSFNGQTSFDINCPEGQSFFNYIKADLETFYYVGSKFFDKDYYTKNTYVLYNESNGIGAVDMNLEVFKTQDYISLTSALLGWEAIGAKLGNENSLWDMAVKDAAPEISKLIDEKGLQFVYSPGINTTVDDLTQVQQMADSLGSDKKIVVGWSAGTEAVIRSWANTQNKDVYYILVSPRMSSEALAIYATAAGIDPSKILIVNAKGDYPNWGSGYGDDFSYQQSWTHVFLTADTNLANQMLGHSGPIDGWLSNHSYNIVINGATTEQGQSLVEIYKRFLKGTLN